MENTAECSLCLRMWRKADVVLVRTNHALKAYSEDGGTAPYILDLSITWRWPVTFRLPLLNSTENDLPVLIRHSGRAPGPIWMYRPLCHLTVTSIPIPHSWRMFQWLQDSACSLYSRNGRNISSSLIKRIHSTSLFGGSLAAWDRPPNAAIPEQWICLWYENHDNRARR
jgi:hypothetical protein